MKQMAKNTACVALGVYIACLMLWGTQTVIQAARPVVQAQAEAVDQ
jgi:hypothetical protein